MGGRPPQIVLVQREPLAQAGARQVLEAEVGTVVADARTMAEALALARVLALGNVRLVVTDHQLADAEGAALVESLTRAFPPARLLVIGSWEQVEDAHAAIAAGAHGLLAREASGEDLQRAALDLLEGGSSVPAALVAGIIRGRGLSSRSEELTAREEALLVLIARGLTNRAAAAELGVSERTVEKQRARLTEKLGAHSRADLVKVALGRHLLG